MLTFDKKRFTVLGFYHQQSTIQFVAEICHTTRVGILVRLHVIDPLFFSLDPHIVT